MWKPNEKEIAAVVNLDGRGRYAYLVKKAADQERVWSLWKESGWALASDANAREGVPIWPHEKFALRCVKEAWQGFEPKEIPLAAWLGRWIPGMARDGRLVAVFPTDSDKGVFVLPGQLAGDLREELENYE